ncbi:MAG: hypothetical protein QM704_11540 [Anaeromyxobacteraceae bacterium]
MALELALLVAKATALLGAGALVALALRGASAGARHLAWALTLGAALVLPAAARLSPWRLEVLPAPAAVEAPPAALAPADGVPEPSAAPVRPLPSRAHGQVTPARAVPSPSPSRAEAITFAPDPAALAVILWAAGAVLLALRALDGQRAARRLVRAARPCADPRRLDLLIDSSPTGSASRSRPACS